MCCPVRARRVVRPVDPGYPDRARDRQRDGGPGQRAGDTGCLSQQQTAKRHEYVHRQPRGGGSHGRPGCASVQRYVGGFQAKIESKRKERCSRNNGGKAALRISRLLKQPADVPDALSPRAPKNSRQKACGRNNRELGDGWRGSGGWINRIEHESRTGVEGNSKQVVAPASSVFARSPIPVTPAACTHGGRIMRNVPAEMASKIDESACVSVLAR
ncbi:hypothetical protein K0M31_005400 [Melipona bicolor]|uniref:Uncharacterized protein n=1 Tax=Melipona bicolor TaxID=60889 RepID=A0AA40FVI8_9HYME|nr:hypothetical protein K0M31_005400 [Melipona bicolor]